MVIQRWQSVLLLIATVMMGIFTFLSLGQIQLPEYTLNFTTLGFCIEGKATNGAPSGFVAHTWVLFILSLMSCILPFINIFLFKNLPLQKRICIIEILFIVVIAAIGCYCGYCAIPEGEISWSSMIIAPLLAFVATVMAYNRINSDQRKLRSLDRLR